MSRPLHRFRLSHAGLLLGLCVAAFAVVALTPDRQAVAQPRANWRPELTYVPEDAAIFIHADVAQLWNSKPVKAMRDADPKIVAELTTQGKALFGQSPDNVKTITYFVPSFKDPREERFGFVIAFNQPFDSEKLKSGFEKLIPLIDENTKITVHAPNDRLAVVLIGLGEEYAKPRPVGKPGPLHAAISDAATGKHALVAGVTLDSLPDILRGDDLPPQIQPFKPLLRADTITARVDLGADIALDLRVKTQTPAQAVDAEKALGLLGTMVQEELGNGIKEFEKGDDKMLLKDLIALFKAGQTAVKGAKFTTEGTEAKVVVRLPADLPFGGAFVGAMAKTREAASAARSTNNLKQIAIALHNYHDVNNSFPPAAICDKTGKPLLSWRVLILPYIEQDALYKEFKQDEPWDSEHNKKLLAKMPKIYALPTQKPDDTTTHYRVFVGKGAAFDYIQGYRLQDFTDGTSNTIMVVTATDSVPWTKPDELVFDPEKDATKQVGLVVNGRAQAAYCDGSVRSWSKIPERKNLHAYITRNGGEIVIDDE